MTRVLIPLLCALLAGCASQPRTVVQRVDVPVPVVCQEPVPARPEMPTESLAPGSDLFEFTKAAIAEIERREGYELQLAGALENCRRPLE